MLVSGSLVASAFLINRNFNVFIYLRPLQREKSTRRLKVIGEHREVLLVADLPMHLKRKIYLCRVNIRLEFKSGRNAGRRIQRGWQHLLRLFLPMYSISTISTAPVARSLRPESEGTVSDRSCLSRVSKVALVLYKTILLLFQTCAALPRGRRQGI